jgi:MarR family transcriptional regulator, organic hydroperoxide resistance regulator
VRRQRRQVAAPPTTCDAGTVRLGNALEFMRLIWGISHGLQSTSKRMEAELGITGPQRLAIRILGRYPGMSAGELASILRLHPSTLTGVLRRLEDRHALERARSDRDRRETRFRLTAAGRAIDRRRLGTVEHAVDTVLSRLEPEKIAAAEDVLAALEKGLNAPPPVSGRRG